MGEVKAIETIKFSITSHLGCFGECSFCSIAVHQGSRVRSRTEASILREAAMITKLPGFKGIIYDVGGATANMYGMKCKAGSGARCGKRPSSPEGRRCVFPELCKSLDISHKPQIELFRKLRQIPGIKKIFIGSGVRHDLVMLDKEHGREYLDEIVEHHVSGQMKIAPEHTEENVLRRMGKPVGKFLPEFKKEFDKINREKGKNQFLTYYFIAAHPGCSQRDMENSRETISKELKINPQQVQIFTPTPSTYSTLMYYTGEDPFTNEKITVEKDLKRKEQQKQTVGSRFQAEKRRIHKSQRR
jgi:uncharacterized radical SAM protein YgiQ